MSGPDPHEGERSVERIDLFGSLLGVGVSVLLVVMLGRVAQLQIAPSDELRRHIELRESRNQLLAPRGDILDQRGRVMATSRWVYRAVIDPTLLPDPPHEAVVLLADTLGVSPDEIGEVVLAKLAENDRRSVIRAEAEPPAQTEAEPLIDLLGRRLGLGDPAPETLADPAAAGLPRLHRYLPVGPILEGPDAERVARLGVVGVSLERRERREYPGGDLVASIVGKTGLDELEVAGDGWLGAERSFDEHLDGGAGSIRYVRDSRGRPLWVEHGAWDDASPGQALRMSIDLELQRIAVEELTRGIEAADAAGGRLVMADPATGEVLAMVDLYRDVPEAQPFPFVFKDPETGEFTKPHGDLPLDIRDRPRYVVLSDDPGRSVHPALGRNRCVEDVYEPGSTFKPFVWSEAKRLGMLPDDEVLHNEINLYRTPYGRAFKDVTFRHDLTWDDVLKFSSNIGMAQLSERLTADQMQAIIRRLGFGRRTDLGLPGESAGIVTTPKAWTIYSQTSVAIGHEIAVTPVQMVRAFSALARTGDLAGTLPELRLTASGSDGRRGLTGDALILRKAIEPEIAARVRPALRGVVDRMDTNRLRQWPEQARATYSMFGKSGTAEIPCSPPPGALRPRGSNGYFDEQYNSSFIAAAPAATPRLVLLVVIDDPGPSKVRVRQHYGSWVAGPVVRAVMERSLRYLGVEPDLDAEGSSMASAG